MSIAIVETYGSSFRVIGPSSEIVHNGGFSGELIGYSSNFMVWRDRTLITTLDENGRTLGRVTVPREAQVFGVTNNGFIVRTEPGNSWCAIYGPDCSLRDQRNV